MVVKNSFSILMSKLNLVFKVLLFDIIAIALVGGIGYLILSPYYQGIADEVATLEIGSKFNAFIKDVIANGLNFDQITLSTEYTALIESLNGLLALLRSNIATPAYMIVGIDIWIAIYVVNLKHIAVSENVVDYMNGRVNSGFVASLIRNFPRSALYSLIYTIVATILDILLVYLSIKLATLISITSIFAYVVVIAIVLLSVIFRTLILCGWLPHIVVAKQCVPKAFVKGIKGILGDIGEMIALVLFYVLASWIIIYTSFTATVGVATLFLMPLFTCLLRIIELVRYYDIHKMRYYVDDSTIINTPVDSIDIEIKE